LFLGVGGTSILEYGKLVPRGRDLAPREGTRERDHGTRDRHQGLGPRTRGTPGTGTEDQGDQGPGDWD